MAETSTGMQEVGQHGADAEGGISSLRSQLLAVLGGRTLIVYFYRGFEPWHQYIKKGPEKTGPFFMYGGEGGIRTLGRR